MAVGIEPTTSERVRNEVTVQLNLFPADFRGGFISRWLGGSSGKKILDNLSIFIQFDSEVWWWSRWEQSKLWIERSWVQLLIPQKTFIARGIIVNYWNHSSDYDNVPVIGSVHSEF